MNAILNQLALWGCDVDQALNRMMGDEEFLIELIQQVSQDEAFDSLGVHLKNQDAAAAFEDAHTLKGICANTGLTPLCEIIVELVEPLRAGSVAGLLPKHEKLMSKNQELKEKLCSDRSL